MLEKSKLREIDGWEINHYGDNICEWVRELDTSEAIERYEAFILVVQQLNPDEYTVQVNVAFVDTDIGDHLGSPYQTTVDSQEEAMEVGKQYVSEVETEYELS